MRASLKKYPLFDRMINLFVEYNWQVIMFFGFFLLFFEIIEPIIKHESLLDPYHLLEMLFYFSLLILVRVLIIYLVRANIAQNNTLEVLKHKHSIGMELTKPKNWDIFLDELVKLPGKLVAVETSRLHVVNPISGRLVLATSWYKDGIETLDFNNDCAHCTKLNSKDDVSTGVCIFESVADDQKPSWQEVCVPIHFGNDLLGLLQIRMQEGVNLDPQQVEIFENIRPEIGLVLKVRQEQKVRSEMKLAKTALAERRTISTYIHDQLGQNLGYMHLKLDQLVENKSIEENVNIHTDLKRLRDVANKSFEIVRDILKTIRSDTVPNITNLLHEQARIVSRRANFELEFKTIGSPLTLLIGMQQTIFFAFCEALSNIEKHANANEVDVLVVWNDGILDITIRDDGKGFEPNKVQGDDHFGLDIMQEQILGAQGKLVINSSENSGTTVSISVPIQSFEKKAVI